MLSPPLFFALSFVLMITVSFAQNRNANVYFNTKFGINFLNQQFLGPMPRTDAFSFSCISDEKTGKFLFYATGNGIYRPDHSLMKNGGLKSGTEHLDPLIVPMPESDQFYYVFYVWQTKLYYAVVDVTNGVVISKLNFLYDNVSAELRCVSYVHNQGWWLIGHSYLGNDAYAFLVLKNGIVKKPVISKITQTDGQHYLNYSSHKGDKLISVDWGKIDPLNPNAEVSVSLLDFDKRCGLLSFSKFLYKDLVETRISSPAVAFSPDDSKIFLTVDNNVYQYSGLNYSDKVLCFTHEEARYGAVMFPGPDGNIYYTYTEWQQEVPLYKISNPNQKMPLCKAQVWKIINWPGPIYLPAQITDNSYALHLPDPIDFTFDNACAGSKVQFSPSNEDDYDSVEWRFGDSANPNAFSREWKPAYTYMSGKDYSVQLIGYICGSADTVVKTIAVREKATVQLGPDTFFCYGENLTLNALISGGEFHWSTGSTDSSLWVKKEGKYWLKAKNGDCSVTDTIVVKQLPQVWAALGDEYFICDDDKELVKLDAGEGFDQYKWTPTGDTTQWIIVGDLGKYFVVVKDYRGCNGKDGTKVERRCPVSVFYPNAFTPNDDGVNDVFSPVGSDVVNFTIEVYNAWGQRVFESNDLSKGWDGKVKGVPSPSGTYIYKSTYSGYHNKKSIEFVTEGNITLLR